MKDNKLIAEFMGLPLVPCSIGTENGIVYEGYQHPKGGMPFTADGLQYKYSWDWLMPVIEEIDHLQQEPVQSIEDALATRCIGDTHKAVVEFINEYNKYICGSCGDHVNEVVFNEDADVDECTNCTEYYDR